jgi:hypothetical protein
MTKDRVFSANGEKAGASHGGGPASDRSKELRTTIATRFELNDARTSEVLHAFIGAIHDRLGRGLQACLISWIPEAWPFLSGTAQARDMVARGEAQITERIVDAGFPAEKVPELIGTVLGFLESRCGRPLSDAVRRRVPELERMAGSPARSQTPLVAKAGTSARSPG